MSTALLVIVASIVVLGFAEVLLVCHAINQWVRVNNVRTRQFNQLINLMSQIDTSLRERDGS